MYISLYSIYVLVGIVPTILVYFIKKITFPKTM